MTKTLSAAPLRLLLLAGASALVLQPAMAQTDAPANTGADTEIAAESDGAPQMAEPTAQTQDVLDTLVELGAEPIHTLSVDAARAQPTPADAVAAIIERDGIDTSEVDAVLTSDITIPGAEGDLEARVYTPPTGEGPFPVIVYFHGGGWVIAGIDVYDASARQLALGSNAIVVAVGYRQAPENQFPAAHDDAFAAYQYIVENAGQWNGDSSRIAVAGESAGGNLALNVAIAARDAEVTQPIHQLLVYPLAGDDLETESYIENENAQPLGKADIEWFVAQVFADPAETADPRISLYERDDLADLPPATIILAQIDPLRSDGELLGEAFTAAGVTADVLHYDGVVHEFFGMGAVVPEAEEAMAAANAALSAAFAQ